MCSKILVSLTTIPRRLESSVHDVFTCLKEQDLDFDVVISIPRVYQKWGAVDENAVNAIPSWVNVHRPTEDFGPATKLLGALEFADGKEYDSIITVDDDIVFEADNYLSYLSGFSAIDPHMVWTVRGIKLACWPYHNRFGLQYSHEYCYVDAVRGVAGTVYPIRELLSSDLPFTLRNNVPPGGFHDDDAYFGAVLHSMGVPIMSIPRHPNSKFHEIQSSGGSAVAEKQGRDRRTNESEFFRYCVRNKLIGSSLMARRPSTDIVTKMRNQFQKYVKI